MTDLSHLAPAPAPTPPAGAAAAGANDSQAAPASSPSATLPLQAHRDQLRDALERLSASIVAIEATSAAVGTTTVSQVYMVLADLAVATAAVTDAAAAVFLTAPKPPIVIPPSTMFRTTGPWIAGSLYTVVPEEALAAVPDNNDRWFAITSGKYVGLTKNAALSLAAVVGVSNALSTSFTSQAEVLDHFNSALEGNAVAVIR